MFKRFVQLLMVAFATSAVAQANVLKAPDVLVKGADYSEDQVVGGDLVKSWGGEVRLAEVVDGYSTTAAIARMTRKEEA